MPYSKRLFIAKCLVTLCVLNYALVPLFIDFGPSHLTSENWTPHGRFHLSWTLIYHLMALPVLLSAIWSKLHGTGRSVRLVAFLGLAYTGSFFVATALKTRLGSDLHDPGHEHLVMGIDGNMANIILTFTLLVIAVVLSIRKKNPQVD